MSDLYNPNDSLSDLPAEMIARLDAVCLQYELMLNNGETTDVEELVRQNSHLPADVLRNELELVRREILAESPIAPPVSDRSAAMNKPPLGPAEAFGIKPNTNEPFARDVGTGVSSESQFSRTAGPGNDHNTSVDPSLVEGSAMTPPPPGALLGPYEIESQLDKGGMGIVYRAIDLRLRRDVAIKFLAPHLAAEPTLVSRFDRENRAVAAISHPNIVELFDIGRHGALPYAVMEFLRGDTLATFIRRGPMGHLLVRRIASQIASALATAHAAGVIHRDLKPGNVMLLRQSGGEIVGLQSGEDSSAPPQPKVELKLFDFGLSRLEDLAAADPASEVSSSVSKPTSTVNRGKLGTDNHTIHGTVMGTPGYMAPEQIHGDPATSAVDLFALGAILYECWTGRRAFDGTSRDDRFAATMADRPEIDEARRQADPTLAKIINQCLEKRVDRRPPSAGVIVEDLQRTDAAVISSLSSTGSRSGGHLLANDRRQWIKLTGGVLAAGAAGIIGTKYFSTWRGGSSALAGRVENIQRLAVLSFDAEDLAGGTMNEPQPLGHLSIGRKISTLLVNELSRLPDLSVAAFRAIRADSREQYIETARELGVDALLDGNVVVEKRGTESFLRWDLKLVDAATGDQIWGGSKTTPAADNLLEQTSVAQEIAAVIGRELMPTSGRKEPPSSDSFTCLIRGEARKDYDSTMSLRMARACFRKAAMEDPSFPEPIGGLAMVSMELAGRADKPDELAQFLEEARGATDQVLKLDKSNIEGLLTGIRLAWQMTSRFDEAESILSNLADRFSSNPQVLHQWGRLLLVLGRNREAIVPLREASILDPMSALYRVDLAYARWVGGDSARAIEDLTASKARQDHPWYRGLLIDIAEMNENYSAAAKLDPEIGPTAGVSEAFYYPDRRNRLEAMPYGPYGSVCNRLLWQARTSPNQAQADLTETLDPQPPMAIYLLATHPALKPLRGVARVKELLP